MAAINDKSKLIPALYKDGFSMGQIAKKMGLSPSTIRYWLDKNGIKRRLISDAINSWYSIKFNKKPFKLKINLSPNEKDLKTSGIMLYWGEGAKSGNVVKLSNSDPDLIRLFLNFLRNICGIDEKRLKALIHLYPDHNENELLQFWIKITNIPRERFYKPFIHKGKKGSYKNKVKWGTLAINYPDKNLLKTLLNWINEYRDKTKLPS